MIVDDEVPNRLLLRDPLEHHGYEVSEAASGVDALALIAQHPPDAVLLDVMMPRMDGFQLCRRLKMDLHTAHIPVLLVTALADRKERLQGMKAGANDFLIKPVDLQDLVLRVGNAVYAKTLYDQLHAEREKSDRLLFDTLPQAIAERIKLGELNIADSHSDITVLVSDLAGFSDLAAGISPHKAVSLLNEIFTGFDGLAQKHGLEKIKTMGDAYLAAAGLPIARVDHAAAAADTAIGMRTVINQVNRDNQTSLRLRIGINTGPVIAGVIGRPRFAYDLWGDTVNIACRLEALATPDTILVGPTTAEVLKNSYRLSSPRQVALKNVQITVSELTERL